MLAAAAVLAACLAVRNIALLVAISLPAWTAAADMAGRSLIARLRRPAAPARPRRVTPGGVVAGGLVALCGGLGLGAAVTRAASGASPAGIAAAYPACAATALEAAPGGTRLFAPYGTSGYLIDRLWPAVRVGNDYGELVAAGDTVFADDLRIAAGATSAPSRSRSSTAAAPRRCSSPPGRWPPSSPEPRLAPGARRPRHAAVHPGHAGLGGAPAYGVLRPSGAVSRWLSKKACSSVVSTLSIGVVVVPEDTAANFAVIDGQGTTR